MDRLNKVKITSNPAEGIVTVKITDPDDNAIPTNDIHLITLYEALYKAGHKVAIELTHDRDEIRFEQVDKVDSLTIKSPEDTDYLGNEEFAKKVTKEVNEIIRKPEFKDEYKAKIEKEARKLVATKLTGKEQTGQEVVDALKEAQVIPQRMRLADELLEKPAAVVRAFLENKIIEGWKKGMLVSR